MPTLQMHRAGVAAFGSLLLSRFKLRRCESVGIAPSVFGRVWIHGAGSVRIGNRVTFEAGHTPIELHAGPGAQLVIDDDAVIHGGTSIEATASVTIGERCTIGGFCKILDNQFHPLAGDRSRRPPSKPVVVESDCDLGERSILLPGAYLARGTKLGTGAMVRGRPGPCALAEPPPTAAPAEGSVQGFFRRFRDHFLNTARCVRALCRARWGLRDCELGRRIYDFGGVHVVNEGVVRLHDRVFFIGGILPSSMVCHRGATIEIGEQTGLGYGTSIEAQESVKIGRRCTIASLVRISDESEGRRGPIVIGDDVWLAHGVTVAPGVTIGEASVVSAFTIIARDVPPRSLAIGNPAHFISLALFTAQPAASASKG